MAGDQGDQAMEVLGAFAGAEINAEPRAVGLRIVEEVGIGKRLLGRGRGKSSIGARVRPPLGVGHMGCQVKVLDLSGEGGREAPRVEIRNGCDAALTFNLRAIQILDAMPERRDRAHTGNDDTSSHRKYLV